MGIIVFISCLDLLGLVIFASPKAKANAVWLELYKEQRAFVMPSS
jgi:hypothetical protein